MLLLEADGKELLRGVGIATPAGLRMRRIDAQPALPGSGPWMAKAQVPVGGRGKAGGIRRLATPADLEDAVGALLGSRIKGCETREVLVEEAVSGEEHYLSIMVDASKGGVRLIYSAFGGVDVESRMPSTGTVFNELVPLDPADIDAAIGRLVALAPAPNRASLQDVAVRLARLFCEQQLMLVEINPLFALPGGAFVAGDAKVVVDMNVVSTRPLLRSIFDSGRELYPDAWRKLAEDFDFVEIDAGGQVGLVTTGAGLSMMVIDELVGRGLSPFNFCDMRTGQMRGSPARLIRILDWLAEARNVRVVLVNIFAGITDLSEFAGLLVDALRAHPEFKLPVVARLVGNGEEAARTIIAAHPDLNIVLEPDLEAAIARVGSLLARWPALETRSERAS
jgi:succinyl-CoA synthetase beta subunit